jgi:hypothetical protein
MSSLLKKLEDYNNLHPGCIRKLLSLSELSFLVISIPLTYFIYNQFSGQILLFHLPDYTVFAFAVLITWYIRGMVNSQAKVPRTQRYLYIILNNGQVYFFITLGLLALKFILRLDNIPISYIIVYLSFFFLVTVIFKILGYHFL